MQKQIYHPQQTTTSQEQQCPVKQTPSPAMLNLNTPKSSQQSRPREKSAPNQDSIAELKKTTTASSTDTLSHEHRSYSLPREFNGDNQFIHRSLTVVRQPDESVTFKNQVKVSVKSDKLTSSRNTRVLTTQTMYQDNLDNKRRQKVSSLTPLEKKGLPQSVSQRFSTFTGVSSETQSQLPYDFRSKIVGEAQTATETRQGLRKGAKMQGSPDEQERQKIFGFKLPQLGKEVTGSRQGSTSPRDDSGPKIKHSRLAVFTQQHLFNQHRRSKMGKNSEKQILEQDKQFQDLNIVNGPRKSEHLTLPNNVRNQSLEEENTLAEKQGEESLRRASKYVRSQRHFSYQLAQKRYLDGKSQMKPFENIQEDSFNEDLQIVDSAAARKSNAVSKGNISQTASERSKSPLTKSGSRSPSFKSKPPTKSSIRTPVKTAKSKPSTKGGNQSPVRIEILSHKAGSLPQSPERTRTREQMAAELQENPIAKVDQQTSVQNDLPSLEEFGALRKRHKLTQLKLSAEREARELNELGLGTQQDKILDLFTRKVQSNVQEVEYLKSSPTFKNDQVLPMSMSQQDMNASTMPTEQASQQAFYTTPSIKQSSILNQGYGGNFFVTERQQQNTTSEAQILSGLALTEQSKKKKQRATWQYLRHSVDFNQAKKDKSYFNAPKEKQSKVPLDMGDGPRQGTMHDSQTEDVIVHLIPEGGAQPFLEMHGEVLNLQAKPFSDLQGNYQFQMPDPAPPFTVQPVVNDRLDSIKAWRNSNLKRQAFEPFDIRKFPSAREPTLPHHGSVEEYERIFREKQQRFGGHNRSRSLSKLQKLSSAKVKLLDLTQSPLIDDEKQAKQADAKRELRHSASVDFTPPDGSTLDPMTFVQPFLDQVPMMRAKLDQSIFKSQAPLSVNQVTLALSSQTHSQEPSFLADTAKKSVIEKRAGKFYEQMDKANFNYQRIYNERKQEISRISSQTSNIKESPFLNNTEKILNRQAILSQLPKGLTLHKKGHSRANSSLISSEQQMIKPQKTLQKIEPSTVERKSLTESSPVKFDTKVQGVSVDLRNRENPLVKLEQQLVKISEFESLIGNTLQTQDDRVEDKQIDHPVVFDEKNGPNDIAQPSMSIATMVPAQRTSPIPRHVRKSLRVTNAEPKPNTLNKDLKQPPVARLETEEQPETMGNFAYRTPGEFFYDEDMASVKVKTFNYADIQIAQGKQKRKTVV